jgi:hypothetical protein
MVAGGEQAVRAYTHPFESFMQGSGEAIEFYSRTAPTSSNPGQAAVSWTMPAGEKLQIEISRVVEANGTVTIFPRP